MKKFFFFLISLLSAVTLLGQTTATNFVSTDCSGTSHNLFSELDSGKVVVIVWAMPCPGCIAGSSTVQTKVQSYTTSNPGVVRFYLVDDYGNTTCHTLDVWAYNNNIFANAEFSDSTIRMSDYGVAGMPKIVILGGPNHSIFYNHSGTPTTDTLQTAINNAIIAAGTAGIVNNSDLNTELKLFPNPTLSNAKIKYSLYKSADVSLEIINLLGEKIKTFSLGIQAAGQQEYLINLESLSNGIYFTKLKVGESSQIVELTISH